MSRHAEFICFYENKVLVYSNETNFLNSKLLEIGNTRFSFESASINELDLINGINLIENNHFLSGTDNWKLSVDNQDEVIFDTNYLDENQLEGISTAYLMGKETTNPFEICYIDPVFGKNIPVTSGKLYKFSGLFATHRALGRVEITFHDVHGSMISFTSTILTEHKGGKHSRDYQFVALQGKISPETHYVQIKIKFLSSHNSVHGMPFFIFFSDLSFSINNPDFNENLPLIEKSVARKLVRIARNGASSFLYTAQFDTDLVTYSQVPITILSLKKNKINEERNIIYDPAVVKASNTAKISFDDHRMLNITFTGNYQYKIYCDGRLGDDIEILPSDGANSYARLPYRLLDGQHHSVEVRDFSGLTILSENYFMFPNVLTPWSVLQEHSSPWPPGHLAPAASDRYRALQAAINAIAKSTDSKVSRQLEQLSHCHTVTVRGFEHNKSFKNLIFPTYENPVVTIVIPVHNKFEITYFCLCALLVASNSTSFEVIVVDDGSKDRTTRLSDLVKGISIIRNEVGQGFIGACNRGANNAKGDYIVFLNNDTEPTVGWIDELIVNFHLFDNVGLVGSKLIYPDGRLQEAGGIVWSNGNPWNYGRGQNPNDPRYSYTRNADYLSGAAIMLPLALWNEVGGFSEEFRPAYFEDTDLAFKVRDRGYKTLYASKSVVYHFEGATSGTDLSSGAKIYQELNRPKFKSKWFRSYRNFGKEGVTPDLEKDRAIQGRALFIDYQMPKPDMDAGSYAAIEEMRLVQKLGYKITFVPQNLAYLGRYTDDLQRLGIEVLYAPFIQSIDEYLEVNGYNFDIVYITRYYVVHSCLEAIRRWAPQAKVIMNNADLHFLRELRAGVAGNDQAMIESATQTREIELSVMRRVDLVLTYNDTEQAVILSHNLASTRVMRVPWVERVKPDIKPLSQRRDIAFLGSFNHHPNKDAVLYFVLEIMPLIRKNSPDTNFWIYGSYLPPLIRKLESKDILIGGYIDDISELFDKVQIFVAPLTSGAGIKGKVLKALAHGVPCVLSPIAAEGIGLRSGYDCFIAETPFEWSDSIQKLRSDSVLWEQMSTRGRDLIREKYSTEAGLKTMRRALEAVDLFVS